VTAPRLFLLPVALGALLLVVVPALATLGLALTDYDGLSSPEWTGLANFERLMDDRIFRVALDNSLTFVAVAVPLRLLAALAVGLLVAPARRGAGTLRTAVTLPAFVPDVATALVWLWMLNPVFGPGAATLGFLGVPASDWLLSASGAQAAIVLLGLFGIAEAVIVVAAMRNEVPDELYETSALEGAGAWFTFRRLTLPLLAPVLLLLAARDIAMSLQLSFVPALLITEGGPEYATTYLPLHAYNTAFEFLRFGEAAAVSTVMLAMSGLLTALALLAVRWVRAGAA
jgi:multiple sugar transport system permease protein